MSIERELLKRFMFELTTEADVVSLFNDIKECLAQPEQEPVAWGVYDPYSDMLISIYGYKEKPDKVLKDRFKWVKLYALPPTSEPLSEYEITVKHDETTNVCYMDYRVGFRDAEKAHGIGGGE